MKKKTKNRMNVDTEAKMDLMPMIDIIFQLLIFFLLSAKFISFEGQLQAYLPKDRGDQAFSPPQEINNVTFDLSWDDTQERVVCHTLGYEPPGGGPKQDVYRFADDPNVDRGVAADGSTIFNTRTKIGVGEVGEVMYDYQVPDFREVEEYLMFRKAAHDAAGTGKPLPVIINVTDEVPGQMVVNILDMCARHRITDISINAQEIEY